MEGFKIVSRISFSSRFNYPDLVIVTINVEFGTVEFSSMFCNVFVSSICCLFTGHKF